MRKLETLVLGQTFDELVRDARELTKFDVGVEERDQERLEVVLGLEIAEDGVEEGVHDVVIDAQRPHEAVRVRMAT